MDSCRCWFEGLRTFRNFAEDRLWVKLLIGQKGSICKFQRSVWALSDVVTFLIIYFANEMVFILNVNYLAFVTNLLNKVNLFTG